MATDIDEDIAQGPHTPAVNGDGGESDAGLYSDSAAEGSLDDDAVVGADGGLHRPPRTRRLRRVVVFSVLPIVVMGMGAAAGFLKYKGDSARNVVTFRAQSMQAAKDGTVAMLSYRPDTVDKDLGAAQQRLTGDFKNSYGSLTRDVVVPGAKQRQISAVASVPAVASISVSADDAQVLVFVNQTTVIGNDAPTATASSVRVTLHRVGHQWLISGFEPV